MSALNDLKSRLADVNALETAVAVMDWDQQTFMPPGGSEARAEHVGILARMAHEVFVDDKTASLIENANPENEDDQAMLRIVRREFGLKTKIPTALVEEKARLSSVAHEDWVKARKENNFPGFVGTLKRMFEIARQEAEYLGYTDHIYDALLDQYEEGATAADCRAMFEAIKGPQVELVKAIVASPRQPDMTGIYGDWDEAKQRAFTEEAVKTIGFDMSRGRQDTAPHPFCTNFSVGDVRLTTRFKSDLRSAIFGSLHEAGHGVYEQGSPMEWDRTRLAGGVSLGVHESQSRTWENIVGRSAAFWSYFFPKLKAVFPSLERYSMDDWVLAINHVEPSLIRVEADECTYNLHVLVRFEIECDVLTGALKVEDMPEAWNAKYEQYLGVRPPTDADGCLQDVHWSMGAIGYFPTYSMGNLLSYQIWNALKSQVGDVDALMAAGNFAPIHEWLRDNLYRHGSKYPPKELIQRVTGKPMGAADYLAGLEAKYKGLYQLA